MLVGREPEHRTVAALVATARVGQGGALVLVGEAGIGKTSLLADAAAAAAATGMQVLRATGSESESAVPFGALLQLLRPALGLLDGIPGPQAEALASALALRPGTGADRFAVGAATLSLLSRLADDAPVAVLVDDAHLLDVPSAQALIFAARRLGADPVALLAAVRAGESGPFLQSGLARLAVGGLSLPATADLLASNGRRLSGEDLARLYDLTGGNPLAVVELADEVDQLTAAPAGAPVALPASLARAFARRVDRLTGPARTALLVAAAGPDDLDAVARACRLLAVTVAALEEAEDAGLLRVVAGTVVFRHGLVRSAVYSQAAPSARRAVHRALAEALSADDDRRAWHLGEAALGPDEDVARALAGVAASAGQRSAHAVAAGAYEKATQLSPEPADRVSRLVSAAEAAWLAGQPERSVALLAGASGLPAPDDVRTRIAELRGTVALRTGSVEEARDLLLSAGTARAGTDEPDAAVLLFADAVLACFLLADTATVIRAADEVERLVARCRTPRARLVGAIACGIAGVLTGAGGPDGIRRALVAVAPGDPLVEDLRVAPWLVYGSMFLREHESGRELVQVVVDGLRRRGVVGGLAQLLFSVGRDQATTDRWDDAELTYTEGVQLARESGQTADLAACLAGLAWLEARRGQETRCREHADEAVRLCGPRHIRMYRCWAHFALGDLELGLGRPEEALQHFDALEGLLTALGLVDVDVSPEPERADALLRVGREGEARTAAERYAGRAADKDQPWALARAARALAVTGPDSEADGHFARALEHHDRTPDAFERARTQLAYGSRLRRSRRRVDARPHLRDALTTFEALGAAPWSESAAAELTATGETAARRGASLLSALTSQELQVARLLASGRTTREAAATLFLSPKTVEYHLRHVYGKLGIRSRAELAARLPGEP